MKLSTKPYKGSRDFYPEDMRSRKWMFTKLKEVVQRFAYEEYDGPALESFDLYAAKTGEEIVNTQLYSFTDQGNRKVVIRPEMTPTLARMVASKQRELARPIRWYALPNLWRYEQPGRGRLREHWQFNVDILGADTLASELEIFIIACEILLSFNPPEDSFEVVISHREILNAFLYTVLNLSKVKAHALSKLLDKRAKISEADFKITVLVDLELSPDDYNKIINFLDSTPEELKNIIGENKGLQRVKELLAALEELGYKSLIRFDPSIVRGFDYYTGSVFEIYDRNPENNRSLFGGGRYDNLVGLFGGEGLSGFGFGLGDVTLQNFLVSHGLWEKPKQEARVFLTLFDDEFLMESWKIASMLRKNGIAVECAIKSEKLAKQFKTADRKKMEFVILYGSEERESKSVKVKDLKNANQELVAISDLSDWFSSRLK